MTPEQWAKVIPLLRPTVFDRHEVVCTQGKICPEMFIVDDGLLFATTTYVEPDAGKEKRFDRSLSRGNTTNMLALVKVWNHSLETVVAAVNSDCYGINCEEFCAHFESNLAIFEEMQKLATERFEMVPDPHAPTPLGRPRRRISDKEVKAKELRRKIVPQLTAVPRSTIMDTSGAVVEMVEKAQEHSVKTVANHGQEVLYSPTETESC